METPGRTCQRLIEALECLVAEEQCIVRSGELQKIRAVQERADSVISRLAGLWNDPGTRPRDVDVLRPRLAILQASRADTIGIMDSQLAEMRARLASLNGARARLGGLRNAYGSRRQAGQPAIARLNSCA